jgi:hypothetical protein
MFPELWIERHRRAWETADADEIVDLFTPDASYRSSVFKDPYLGREAIRQYWLRGAGTQREVAVRTGRPYCRGPGRGRVVDHVDRPRHRRNYPARLPLAALRSRRPLPGPVGILAGTPGPGSPLLLAGEADLPYTSFPRR